MATRRRAAQQTMDPNARLATAAQARMQELVGRYGPAFLTGNGLTGLSKHDSRGYSQMLNDETEYRNLERGLKGQGPLQVEYGGVIQPEVQSPFDAATGQNNAHAFGLDAGVSGAALAGLQNSAKKPERDLYTQSQQLRKHRGY